MKALFIVILLLFFVDFYHLKRNPLVEDNQKDTKALYSKARSYLQKSEEMLTYDVDSSLWYGKKSFDLGLKIKNDSVIVVSSYHLAKIYFLAKGDPDQSINYLNISKTKLDKINLIDYRILVNELYASIFKANDDFDTAIFHYKKALRAAENKGDTLSTISLLQSIGTGYRALENDTLELIHYKKAKEYFDFLKDTENKKQDISYLTKKSHLKYNFIEFFNSNDSIKLKEFKHLLTEIRSYNSSEKGLKELEAAIYNALGSISYIQNAWKESVNYYKQAVELQIKLNRGVPAYYSLAKLYYDQEKYIEAKKYLDLYFYSDDICLKITNGKDVFKLAYQVYSQTHDYEKALAFGNTYFTLLENTISNSREELYIEYGKKLETSLKEKEIIETELRLNNAIEKKKHLVLMSISTTLLLTLVFSIYFKYAKTKKKNVELELQKQKKFNTFRTNFLETVSHEIRSPVTTINGLMKLIQKEVTNENVLAYSDIIMKNSNTLLMHSNEIISLLKSEKNMLRLKNSNRNLNKFVKELFFSYRLNALEENQSLVFKTMAHDDLCVEMDFEKLERILSNLITNALKYSNENSPIELILHLTTSKLSIKVIDEGIGIDNSKIKAIFSKYHRIAHNIETDGIGIGLAIVKSFTDFLGGNISVVSKVNKGSTFKIVFPINVERKYILETEKVSFFNPENEKADQIQIRNKKPKLLIVDDDKSFLIYLKEILSPKYSCTIVKNSIVALQKVREETFDLIISDLQMAGINGLEFKIKLKDIEGYDSVPFIILSATDLSEVKTKGFTVGIDDFIIKPFREKELLARIDNLLRNKLNKIQIVGFNENDIIVDYNKSFNYEFIKKLTQIVEENIENSNFKVKELALECSYSQRQLTRLLKKINGLTPIEFILEMRLLKAYSLLQNNSYSTLKEIHHAVGIQSYSYFIKRFKNRFGITPMELFKKPINDSIEGKDSLQV